MRTYFLVLFFFFFFHVGVTKDTAFAIWFGAPGMPKITPLDFPVKSWGLFFVRDVMTIGAGFVFPGIASSWMQRNRVRRLLPVFRQNDAVDCVCGVDLRRL